MNTEKTSENIFTQTCNHYFQGSKNSKCNNRDLEQKVCVKKLLEFSNISILIK